MGLFQTDQRYVRFLAAHPGLWGEVGALEDRGFLDVLTRERRALGLVSVAARLRAPRRRGGRTVR